MRIFHHIRRRFLSGSNFRKYTLYAVGELILITVGILLALQLNNWNQDRLDQSVEMHNLRNLRQDIISDIDMINNLIISRYDRKMASLRMTKEYVKGEFEVTDTLEFLRSVGFGAVFAFGFPRVNNNTYEGMLANGSFRTIEDIELQEAILDYYGYFQGVSNIVEYYWSGYMTAVNGARPFDLRNPDQIDAFDQSTMFELFQSRDMLHKINLELTLGHRVYAWAEEILERAATIQELIDQELEE